MASKKDFAGMNTGRVYNTIEQATSRRGQQGTVSPQEAAERASKLKTQGRKGCKAVRINMAFTPENYDFLKTVSKAYGSNMTVFCNKIIEDYRKDHTEIYTAVKAVQELINQ